MSPRLLAFAAVLLMCADGRAFAEGSSETPAVYVAPEASAYLEFKEAIGRAEAMADQRWAFTAAFEDLADQPGRVIRARFDPRKPAGERWSLITAEKLSKAEQKTFERLASNDEADDALVYDRLGESAKDARPVSVTPETAVFRLKLDDPKMSEEIRNNLTAIATFDRRAKHVSDITVSSVKAFKPAPVAKVEMMRQVQRYAPVGPDGAVLMTAAESAAKGSAMLKKFNSQTRILYSDFAKVDAEPFKRAGAAAGK